MSVGTSKATCHEVVYILLTEPVINLPQQSRTSLDIMLDFMYLSYSFQPSEAGEGWQADPISVEGLTPDRTKQHCMPLARAFVEAPAGQTHYGQSTRRAKL